MNLLTELFGIETTLLRWNKKVELPEEIQGLYRIWKCKIDGINCILISPKCDLETIPTLKKHIMAIRSIDNYPVIIYKSSLSTYRKKALIQQRIPFITDKQVYLPFMATYLEKAEEEHAVETFSASTQQVFLCFIYQNESTISASQITKSLSYSAMTISRAIRELKSTDVFRTTKDGVNLLLKAYDDKVYIYDRVKKYMFNPVIKRGFIDKSQINNNMHIAGMSALSLTSSIKDNEYLTYAVYKKAFNQDLMVQELVDPDSQVALEIWEYDPKIFAKDKIADPISVALSFKGNHNEKLLNTIDTSINSIFR